MAKQLKSIKIDMIKPNPQNNRSMNMEDIDLIADTIALNGLHQLPLVYPSVGEGGKQEYILLSGHRRIAALKRLNERMEKGEKMPEDGAITKPVSEIVCIVRDKPTDDWEEQEILTEANITRRRPEEITNEIALASREWESMDTARRKEYIRHLKERFIRNHKGEKAYESDPRKYADDNFRGKYEYIRFVTGLDSTNYIIKKTLAELLTGKDRLPESEKSQIEKEPEAPMSKEEEVEERKAAISPKQVGKSLLKPLGNLEKLYTDDDDMLAAMVDNLKDSIDEFLDYVGVSQKTR